MRSSGPVTAIPESPHRERIEPLASDAARPVWSVMIPTHDCAGFLGETLASVLAQDQGPERMQIDVVDDASTRDDPEAIVRELGGARVGFYRQLENVGHTRNFATCLQRSRGELVHLLHGDDAVRPGFYETMERPFRLHRPVGAAFCRYVAIDEHGEPQTTSELFRSESGVLEAWLERIALGQALQTPSMVVRREVYERLGGFDRRLSWTEDWEMWVRIAAHYPVWYEPEPLALYRVHQSSSSSNLTRSGGTIRDARRAIEFNREHLPPARRDDVTKSARGILAATALRRARRLLHQGEARAAAAHALEALRTRPSPRTVFGMAYLSALWLRRTTRELVARAGASG